MFFWYSIQISVKYCRFNLYVLNKGRLLLMQLLQSDCWLTSAKVWFYVPICRDVKQKSEYIQLKKLHVFFLLSLLHELNSCQTSQHWAMGSLMSPNKFCIQVEGSHFQFFYRVMMTKLIIVVLVLGLTHQESKWVRHFQLETSLTFVPSFIVLTLWFSMNQ